MESLLAKCGERDVQSVDKFCENGSFIKFGEECRGSNSSSEATSTCSSSSSSSGDGSQNKGYVSSEEVFKEDSEPPSRETSSDGNVKKLHQNDDDDDDDDDAGRSKHVLSELEMLKERFAKLLLGEDMSGGGKGVCTAMAISNAITNLCATFFGQLWRLEPLSAEKKYMWRREMNWLLCVSDQIVEFKPSWQTFHDGSKLEVMSCRPRLDLYINLPALRKLDNMLIDVLDSFKDAEFWYIDKGMLAPETDGSGFHKTLHHQEKWWLPSPRVPPCGLSENTRKQLEQKRECANQILKAAMAINSNTLAEMEVPASYIDSLPKNGRTSLGDVIYRCITSEKFSPEHVLDCLDLTSEHQALETANRVEAASYVWRRRTVVASTPCKPVRANPRPSWGIVKEMMMADGEKRELLASRADILLLCLKQRFPGLTQTTLDMTKIQFNKDVGKSILEAYSRVLESLASNIIARMDDLFYIDDLVKNTAKLPSVPVTVSIVSHKRVTIPFTVPVSGTPYKASHAASTHSPQLVSPARGGERIPFISNKLHGRGFGVKKVLTDYLGVEPKDR